MSNKEEIRGYVITDLKRMVKAVAALRPERDWTMSDVLQEALLDWLSRPENQDIIKKHHLKALIEEDQPDHD